MRDILLNIQNKKRPLIMVHMAATAHGPENSKQAILDTIQYNPDIIEIDVRKSKDGVLFCHHGSVPFGVLRAQFLRFLNFSFTIKSLGTINTTVELIEVIPENIIVYLDIKDKNINAAEILEIINRFSAHKIWLAAYSLKQLKEFRSNLGERCIYVYNRPVIFLNIFIKKAKGVIDIAQLFIWQWNDRCVKIAQANDIAVHLERWFMPATKKLELGIKHGNIWLMYDDLRLVQKSHKF